MKKTNNVYLLLFFIFVLTLGFRLYFTFQTNNFSGDDAYFHLRHIISLVEGNFIYYDELSYGGRYVVYPPLFHLIMAFLSFGNTFLLKLIPEVLLSSVVFIVFLLSKDISGNNNVSLMSALFSGFIPLFLVETVNNLSVYSFSIPLILLSIYFFIKRKIGLFLIAIILLSLMHLSSFLLILGLLFYIFLLIGEDIELEKLEKELILVGVILVLLFAFIFYKRAFLEYGIGVFSQGIPSNIASDYFKNINIFDLVFGIGLLPLVFGSYGVFVGMKGKKKSLYLVNGFIFSIFLLLVFRLIEFYIAIMILGIFLSIVSSIGLADLTSYYRRTRLEGMGFLFSLGMVALIMVLMVFPVVGLLDKRGFIHDQQVHDLEWIRENSKEWSVVLGLLNEGNLISSIAERRNVIDDNFLLANDPLERLEDVDVIYKTGSEAIALELIKKYDINFIYFSDDAGRIYHKLMYADNEKCFKKLRSRIYEVIC